MATNIAHINYPPYVGTETTKGNRVPAETYLKGLLFSAPSAEDGIAPIQSEFAKYLQGIARGAGHASGSISGVMDYRSALMFWQMLGYLEGTETTGEVHTHTIKLQKRAADPFKTASIQWGDDTYADAVKYCTLTEGGFSFDAQGGAFIELSGSWISQRIAYDKIRYLDVSGATGGNIVLDVRATDTTEPISYDATDAEIKAALEAISNVVEVAVSSLEVTFTTPAGSTVEAFTIVDDTTDDAVTATFTDPTYTISTGSASTGTYRIRVETLEATSILTFDESAGNIQTALLALTSLNTGDVTCSGGPLNTSPVMIEIGGKWDKTQYDYKTIVIGVSGMLAPGTATCGVTRISPDITDVELVPITVGDNGDTSILFARTQDELDTATYDGNSRVPLIFNGEFSISDARSAVFELARRRNSFTEMQETQRSVEFSLGIGGGTGASILRYFKELCGDNIFWCRIESISCRNIGATSTPFKQTIDMSVVLTAEGGMEEMEGAGGRTFTLALAEDPSADYVMKVTLVNDLASI